MNDREAVLATLKCNGGVKPKESVEVWVYRSSRRVLISGGEKPGKLMKMTMNRHWISIFSYENRGFANTEYYITQVTTRRQECEG